MQSALLSPFCSNKLIRNEDWIPILSVCSCSVKKALTTFYAYFILKIGCHTCILLLQHAEFNAWGIKPCLNTFVATCTSASSLSSSPISFDERIHHTFCKHLMNKVDGGKAFWKRLSHFGVLVLNDVWLKRSGRMEITLFDSNIIVRSAILQIDWL